MAIFLDTGFYLGLIHKKDVNYTRAHEWLIQIRTGIYGQLYTSNYVLAEGATLVASRTNGNPKAISKFLDLLNGSLRIATLFHVSEEEEGAALNLFQKMASSNELITEEGIVSFVDCTIIIACKQRDIEYIASFDGHFKGWLSYPN